MDNRVVHFEIPCDEPQKTMNFFTDVFGWRFNQFEKDEYWIAITGDDKTPGINGGILKKREQGMPVINSINVENIDEAIKKIEKAGGKIVKNKRAVSKTGWLAFFSDPDGNIHGVWQDDPSAKELAAEERELSKA